MQSGRASCALLLRLAKCNGRGTRGVGGVQAATAAQSRARIAARVVYAIDATVTARLRSAGSVRAWAALCCSPSTARYGEKVTSTASKGDLAFVSPTRVKSPICTAFAVACVGLAWARGLRTLAGVALRVHFVRLG